MELLFVFLVTVFSIAGGALIVLIIVRGVNHAKEMRQQTYMKTLEKGIYDYRLVGEAPSSGTAVLGWGIFFASIGLALFISFIALGIIGEAIPGALVPLFMGLGLILYYFIRKNIVGDVKSNGDPVRLHPPDGGEPPRIADE